MNAEMEIHPDGLITIDWGRLRTSLPPSQYRNLRVVIDPVIAAALLILLLPVLALIALSVHLDLGRPVLFRHLRVGQYGVPFTIVKFRTLSNRSPLYSQKVPDDDVRLTSLGQLLRRTGLDELPQLLNVVRGEMGLIGPRPEQLGLINDYEPWQHERHLLKPGITGWWQVHKRGSEPLSRGMDRDIYYLRNQSLFLDIRIVLSTLRVLGFGILARGAVFRKNPVSSQVATIDENGEVVGSREY